MGGRQPLEPPRFLRHCKFAVFEILRDFFVVAYIMHPHYCIALKFRGTCHVQSTNGELEVLKRTY